MYETPLYMTVQIVSSDPKSTLTEIHIGLEMTLHGVVEQEQGKILRLGDRKRAV